MIDIKYLKGLKWNGAVDKGVKEVDGRKLRIYEPIVRDLVPSDVISEKDYGEYVCFVTSDGQKYKVSKAVNVPKGV